MHCPVQLEAARAKFFFVSALGDRVMPQCVTLNTSSIVINVHYFNPTETRRGKLRIIFWKDDLHVATSPFETEVTVTVIYTRSSCSADHHDAN